MERPWNIIPATIPSSELQDAVGGHPLVAQILAQRGIHTPPDALAFLDPDHYAPSPPTALIGVAEAAQLLHEAVSSRRNILVWGDFDVDGQTSTSLLVAALLTLANSEKIRFHVPNRFKESHGIKLEFLKPWLEDPDWRPDLLLTCDTGIAEAEAIGYAKEQGLTVVVTDHHDLTPEFQTLSPNFEQIWGQNAAHVGEESVRRADAIVNPKFQPADDPLRTLPGVGVAYKLIQQLYTLAGRSGEEYELLDLVALGIVADVAEQVHDARYLLQLGLDQLRQTKRTGLLALMDVARVQPATVDTESIGFQIGPRMNALGRLEDATVSVELLTTKDPIRAGQLAARLERLNQERRLLTKQTTDAALEMIERNPQLLDYNGLVLAHPAWHAGIVGIVASRLVEEFNRPTILLLTPPGEPARGSARSVDGVDIGASIAACSHLLLGHGGHPGAAGMSLLPENIDAFRRELDRQIELHRTGDGPPGLTIDAELSLEQLDMKLVEEVQRLAPFGNGNPTPQFLSRGLRVVEERRIGREGNHRRFMVELAQQNLDNVQDINGTEATENRPFRVPVLWFNADDAELPEGLIDLVYTLSINEYRGERSLQLMYVATRSAQRNDREDVLDTGLEVQLHDLRGQSIRPNELPGPEQAIWYAEGIHVANKDASVTYAPRTAINGSTSSTLVLWSVPPSAPLLQSLLERTEARSIYLCGQNTSEDMLSSILRQVGSMCKFALNQDGIVPLERLAARLGTTTKIVRHSLLWLESRGLITLKAWIDKDKAQIEQGDGQENQKERTRLQSELEALLAEVRAYRSFFQRAKTKELGIG